MTSFLRGDCSHTLGRFTIRGTIYRKWWTYDVKIFIVVRNDIQYLPTLVAIFVDVAHCPDTWHWSAQWRHRFFNQQVSPYTECSEFVASTTWQLLFIQRNSWSQKVLETKFWVYAWSIQKSQLRSLIMLLICYTGWFFFISSSFRHVTKLRRSSLGRYNLCCD